MQTLQQITQVVRNRTICESCQTALDTIALNVPGPPTSHSREQQFVLVAGPHQGYRAPEANDQVCQHLLSAKL